MSRCISLQLSEGTKPNLELLEKNCFLRRFHRKVTPDKSDPWQKKPRTIVTPDKSYPGQSSPRRKHPWQSLPGGLLPLTGVGASRNTHNTKKTTDQPEHRTLRTHRTNWTLRTHKTLHNTQNTQNTQNKQNTECYHCTTTIVTILIALRITENIVILLDLCLSFYQEGSGYHPAQHFMLSNSLIR